MALSTEAVIGLVALVLGLPVTVVSIHSVYKRHHNSGGPLSAIDSQGKLGGGDALLAHLTRCIENGGNSDSAALLQSTEMERLSLEPEAPSSQWTVRTIECRVLLVRCDESPYCTLKLTSDRPN